MPTKRKPKPGSKVKSLYLLLGVNVSVEGLLETPCAILKLDRGFASILHNRIKACAAIKESNPLAHGCSMEDLYQLVLWDGSLDWFDRSALRDKDADQKIWDDVDAGSVVVAPDDLAASIRALIEAGDTDEGDGATIRSDCDRCVVTERDVAWQSYVKHTSIEMTTEAIRIENLDELLEKLA